MGIGIFDSGNSESNSTSNTFNYDQRVVADGGGVGLSGNGSTFNVTDAGIAKRAFDSTDANFKLVTDSAGKGLSALLDATQSMFAKQSEQATAMAGTVEKNVLDAYRNAASDKTGTIDNKTIIALAVAAVVAVVFLNMRRKA